MLNRFIGLTIKEALTILKKNESFFQYYIVMEQTKTFNMKKYDSKIYLTDGNGKRAYRIIKRDYLIFAENKELEKDNFIINVKIEKGESLNFNFDGYKGKTYHNVYYFYVSHFEKGQKQNKHLQNKTEQLEPFTEQELKKVNHRFIL